MQKNSQLKNIYILTAEFCFTLEHGRLEHGRFENDIQLKKYIFTAGVTKCYRIASNNSV